jgi:hypothetical protein
MSSSAVKWWRPCGQATRWSSQAASLSSLRWGPSELLARRRSCRARGRAGTRWAGAECRESRRQALANCTTNWPSLPTMCRYSSPAYFYSRIFVTTITSFIFNSSSGAVNWLILPIFRTHKPDDLSHCRVATLLIFPLFRYCRRKLPSIPDLQDHIAVKASKLRVL